MSDPTSPIADATCLACGCLCDDIALTTRDGRIVEAERACPIGRDWFLGEHRRGARPIATVEGVVASFDDAVSRAASILSASRSPLVLGLTQTTLESQRLAVAIADRIGATIDPRGVADSLPRWRAVQRVGMVSATLGEVKNRADVIVFWGVDPVATHPRHLERYSGEPIGRFVSDGRKGRTIVVVDAERTATAEGADGFAHVDRDRQGEALATLRMLAGGIEPNAVDPALRELAATMRRARYGAFFFGPSLTRSSDIEEAIKLVRDLNATTRFVALSMGGPGNAAGAEAVLCWQAGSPRAVDFAAGFPRFLPDEATAERRLSRGEADAALVVADDPAEFLSPDALAFLHTIPTIAIAPMATDRRATVALNSATTGIDAGGTVMRCDGALLPLRPALATTLPDDRAWLAAILARLETNSP